MTLTNRNNLREMVESLNSAGSECSTFTSWQPRDWKYWPPPTEYHVINRHWMPPRNLPWYYTCDPMYLLGYLALWVGPATALVILVHLLIGWLV